MKQRWIDLLAALSVVLCVATVLAALLSYWRTLDVAHSNHVHTTRVMLGTGSLCFLVEGSISGSVDLGNGFSVYHLSPEEAIEWRRDLRANADRVWRGLGFEWVSFETQTQARGVRGTFYWKAAAIPMWFVIVLSALQTGWILRLRRRRSLGARGYCDVCGYDLRATPNQCPECGRLAQNKTP